MCKSSPSLNSLFCSWRFGALRKISSRQSFYASVLTLSKNAFIQPAHVKTVLSFGHHGPSISPSPWRPLCLQKFLRVQVPLGCLKTAFVTQGLGSREFVKTMEVSIIFRLPERRNVSCRLYEIHSKANLLCNGYLSPNTWKKLILTYYILCLFKVIVFLSTMVNSH